MPEGPEIAREADQIRAALEGVPIENVQFAFTALQRRAREFVGTEVESVRARGKAMLIRFNNDLTIYSHNQLYGRWYVRKTGVSPRTNRQLRLAIETASRRALLYSASEIQILDTAGLLTHAYLAKLGPDALDPALDAEILRLRLDDARFARRRLGTLLLDQQFVAGIGNYLRSEICFEARVHPALRPAQLSPVEKRRLARAVLKMARRAYRTGGVTNAPSRARSLRRKGLDWEQARHWVFDREQEPCWRCNETIERFDLAGRRVYVCRGCQPASS